MYIQLSQRYYPTSGSKPYMKLNSLKISEYNPPLSRTLISKGGTYVLLCKMYKNNKASKAKIHLITHHSNKILLRKYTSHHNFHFKGTVGIDHYHKYTNASAHHKPNPPTITQY